MCIARPDRAWFYAGICSLGAVLGGYLGYAIGALLYDSVGSWLIGIYGLQDKAAHLIATSQDYWFWVLVTKGLTPIPFKIVTIMSGFLHFDIWKFTIGMVVSRVTFFVMIAVALRFYGDDIRIFIEKHLPMTALALVVVDRRRLLRPAGRAVGTRSSRSSPHLWLARNSAVAFCHVGRWAMEPPRSRHKEASAEVSDK